MVQKERAGEITLSISDIAKTVLILIAASLIGMLFDNFEFTRVNIITVYILGVLITSVVTQSRVCGIAACAAGVLAFNFLFTEPRYTFTAYDSGYTVTFAVMFITAFITGSLASRLKKNAREKEYTAMLAENEKFRANLLRSISHDLRTPLTSISGNAGSLLHNGSSLTEETKNKMYGDIYDDSMWLINLVENLLAVTRFSDGKVELKMSSELIDDVIDEALKHVNRQIIEHNITVESRDDFLLARMDARLIVQVVINIVDNAVKYTPKGSDIHIETFRKGEEAVVRISDNGAGIPDEVKKQIFEMFYSGANTVADSRRSLGLGLSLCRSIIEAHGGTLEVSDNIPSGAVFTFTLKIAEVDLNE